MYVRASMRLDEAMPEEPGQTQRWVHHVADLETGRVLSTTLDHPIGPGARAERLSALGPALDTSIFGGPAYRLTPRAPYQAHPEASFIATRCDYSSTEDSIAWQPPRDAGVSESGALRASFAVSPDRRSVVSILLSGAPWPGMVGHVSLRETQSAGSVRIPIAEAFATHTIDLTFVPLGGRLADVLMQLEPGIEMLTFTAISFAAVPPASTQTV